MFKLLIVVLFLIFNFFVYANECEVKAMTYCSKMRLVDSTKFIGIIDSSIKLVCYAELEEIESKKINKVRLNNCPVMSKEASVYIRYNCLTGFNKGYDRVEIFEKGSCVEKPLHNLSLILNLLKKEIIPGTTVGDLEKYNLERIKIENNIWTYHSKPGVSLIVEVEKNCNDSVCFEDKNMKIEKIIKVKTEFINFIENRTDNLD